MSAYVYRCYDEGGELLYVGCAFNPRRRISTHMRSRKTLASHALQILLDRYEVEGPYATREAAEEAERAAIFTEQPLLNRQHLGDNFCADRRVALYLADRGIALEEVGLHLCIACGWLQAHHMRHDLCFDCREAAEAGELDEWLAAIA